MSRYHSNGRTVVKRVVQIDVFWLSVSPPTIPKGRSPVAYNDVNKRNATHVNSNATVLLRTLRPISSGKPESPTTPSWTPAETE